MTVGTFTRCSRPPGRSRHVKILKGHLSTKPVRSLCFSPDGTKLASSARDYRTFVWDLATGKYDPIVEGDSYTVAFSPDGRTIATGCSSAAWLWDSSSRMARRLTFRFNHTTDSWSYSWDLAFSPDSKTLAAVGGMLRLYDAATLDEVPVPKPKADAPLSWTDFPPTHFASNSLAFSRDGATLATGHDRVNRKLVRL